MHDYADALWIRHWNIKRYGKTRILVGCLSKKKTFCPTAWIRRAEHGVQLQTCCTPGSSPKDKTCSKLSKLLWKYIPATNSDTSAGPLTVSPARSLNLHSPQPAHHHLFLCTRLPLFLSFLSLSRSLSLPIPLSVGGLHKKVVHFWIRCFFEVQPSLPPLFSLSSAHLLSYLLLHLQHPPVSIFFFYPPCSISFLAKLRLLVFCNFSSLHLLFFPLWSGNYHVLPPLARRLFLIDLTWPWHWTFVHFIKA